ncbi:hypothetical protein BSU04_05590 [Caballeronia sordidicola]|jgi:hypothetical protein|uniref:Uncharacterized protein n=1 Tax=Caballeronia sordidicola TaxID=196367 RepID=A0A226X8B1_CABSO|nr:hypothetical protein BSU04_05590 [Caballeronia sordidicola]
MFQRCDETDRMAATPVKRKTDFATGETETIRLTPTFTTTTAF